MMTTTATTCTPPMMAPVLSVGLDGDYICSGPIQALTEIDLFTNAVSSLFPYP